MAHDSQDFSSPQEAIEGYLEALLQDVAEYDEPEQSPEEQVPATPKEKTSGPAAQGDTSAALFGKTNQAEPTAPEQVGAVDAKSSAYEAGSDEAVTDAEGTRVFAPPSARAYAREAAEQIRQRQKSTTNTEPAVDIAFKEAPTVVMPELKVAEPEVLVTEPEVAVQTEARIEVPEVEVPEVEIPAPVQAEPAAAVEEQLEQETAVVEDTELQPQENEGWTEGRPDWAQGRFECLLFVVKGLKLAVPLAELGGIHKLEKAPTPLFGQPGWFLGIVRTNNMNVGLVDTAQWVMSEHIKDDHKPDFRFAIRIHNSEWGLACHQVAEAISLDPSEVKWRTKLGRRPWLAGTVVDHMCALIDVAAFARLLDSDKVPVDLQALMADNE